MRYSLGLPWRPYCMVGVLDKSQGSFRTGLYQTFEKHGMPKSPIRMNSNSVQNRLTAQFLPGT